MQIQVYDNNERNSKYQETSKNLPSVADVLPLLLSAAAKNSNNRNVCGKIGNQFRYSH